MQTNELSKDGKYDDTLSDHIGKVRKMAGIDLEERLVPPQTKRDLADVDRFVGNARFELGATTFQGRYGWRLVDAVAEQAAQLREAATQLASVTKWKDQLLLGEKSQRLARRTAEAQLAALKAERDALADGWDLPVDLDDWLSEAVRIETEKLEAQLKAAREALADCATALDHAGYAKAADIARATLSPKPGDTPCE